MKNKHRIKQGLSLLLAGGIALTNLGAALPAFAEDAAATPETASAASPETAEANVPTPNLSQITENLYDDLPDAPTGSYLGSMGLPVATGETKIGISAWVSDLYDGVDAHMDADALNAEENTVTIGKNSRYRLCHCSAAGAGRIPGRWCSIRNYTAGRCGAFKLPIHRL